MGQPAHRAAPRRAAPSGRHSRRRASASMQPPDRMRPRWARACTTMFQGSEADSRLSWVAGANAASSRCGSPGKDPGMAHGAGPVTPVTPSWTQQQPPSVVIRSGRLPSNIAGHPCGAATQVRHGLRLSQRQVRIESKAIKAKYGCRAGPRRAAAHGASLMQARSPRWQNRVIRCADSSRDARHVRDRRHFSPGRAGCR